MAAKTTTPIANPFKALRIKQNISQYELARRVGVSKHAILRLEQGCYDQPLPSVIDYFTSHRTKAHAPVSRTHLINQYAEFQYDTRLSNAHLLGSYLKDHLAEVPVGTHPLAYLREAVGINPTELAKRLCISQSTIVYFERRAIHQHTVPTQIIKALHDAEYTEEDTDALVVAYDKYRKWLSSEKRLTLVSSIKDETVSSAVGA